MIRIWNRYHGGCFLLPSFLPCLWIGVNVDTQLLLHINHELMVSCFSLWFITLIIFTFFPAQILDLHTCHISNWLLCSFNLFPFFGHLWAPILYLFCPKLKAAIPPGPMAPFIGGCNLDSDLWTLRTHTCSKIGLNRNKAPSPAHNHMTHVHNLRVGGGARNLISPGPRNRHTVRSIPSPATTLVAFPVVTILLSF
jgi:hypothetical protein